MYDPLVLTPVVESSPSSRRFSRAEADRSLVYVGPVARDVQAAYAEVVRLRQALDAVSGDRRSEPGAAEYRRAMDRLAALVDELAAAGVELRDFEEARLAFPAADELDGCFTWRPGEPGVSAEHEAQVASG